MFHILALVFTIVSASAADKPVRIDSIPAGAVIVSPGVFRHTDSAGKTWIFRKTPFGFVKAADNPVRDDNSPRAGDSSNPFGQTKEVATRAAVADGSGITRVTEKGGELHFERKNPFGVSKWTRKKTELNAAEQEAWDKSQSASPGTK